MYELSTVINTGFPASPLLALALPRPEEARARGVARNAVVDPHPIVPEPPNLCCFGSVRGCLSPDLLHHPEAEPVCQIAVLFRVLPQQRGRVALVLPPACVRLPRLAHINAPIREMRDVVDEDALLSGCGGAGGAAVGGSGRRESVNFLVVVLGL